MNKVILKGNLTKDAEMQTTNSGIAVAKFTIAVQRKFTNANGERETDFINCIAWRNTAEFVNKHFNKGKQILVCGSLQTRSYEGNDGQKKYFTEVMVDEVDFCGSAEQKEIKNEEQQLTQITDEDLPF